MQQTISANAKSFLEDYRIEGAISFKPRGRRFEVAGDAKAVAVMLDAAKAVDKWLAADQALQRKHAAALRAGEAKLSAALSRELKAFNRLAASHKRQGLVG